MEQKQVKEPSFINHVIIYSAQIKEAVMKMKMLTFGFAQIFQIKVDNSVSHTA
jgi:hypothetical protein